MAAPDRPPTGHLAALDGLQAEPYRFDAFEALRRIECAYPDGPRLGESARPFADAVRLRQLPSLAFAAAALQRFKPREGEAPAVLEQVFYGLFGPNAPLPLHLTEYALLRMQQQRDATLVRFADIFHHRLLSLLYRAWASSRPAVSLDRPETDAFRRYIDSLIGLGQKSLRDRDAWPDSAKRYFAGRLASAARPPEGLEAALSSYFALRVRVEEYAAEWLLFGPNVQLKLGGFLGLAHVPGSGGALGVDAVIGVATWSAQHRFRIVAGPLSGAEFDSWLPHRGRLQTLSAVVRNYVGDELAWELKLLVRAPEVPSIRLGESGLLGWNSWLAPSGKVEGVASLRPLGAAATMQ